MEEDADGEAGLRRRWFFEDKFLKIDETSTDDKKRCPLRQYLVQLMSGSSSSGSDIAPSSTT